MIYLLSLALTSALGILLLECLSIKKPLDLLQKIVLGIAVGSGLSGQMGFYSLIMTGGYHPLFVLSFYTASLIILAVIFWKSGKMKPWAWNLNRTTLLGLGALSLLLIPLWREAHFFPFGGWDAWSCWNLKGRFIFLGGENWKNMLDPVLWRSNNHYPFLLPLINAWGWIFYKDANVIVPMFNAILFTFLTALLMFTSLRSLTGHRLAWLAPLAVFGIPFVNKLSISQYSDIVVAFYLLAGMSCLTQAKLEKNPAWALIAGLCAGLMSFTKTEGEIACFIIVAVSFIFLRRTGLLSHFLTGAFATFLPTVLFKMLYSPQNAAFINGLASGEDLGARLQIIFMFLTVELVSLKWNGVWILLILGLCLAGRKPWDPTRWVAPAVLTAFMACALGYYFLNTYFELTWWLKTSLNRVLYTILPTAGWWAFYSLLSPVKK